MGIEITYEVAMRDRSNPTSLHECIMEHIANGRIREAERRLHSYTNVVKGPIRTAGHWIVQWRQPALTSLFGIAPRYMHSPKAAMRLVREVERVMPPQLDLTNIAQDALRKVAKNDDWFWGDNIERHIAHAIILELLERIKG